MESHGNAVGDGVGIDTVGSTLHWGTDYRNNRFNQTSTTYKLPSGTFNDDFHLFGLEWSPTSITTTVDGIPVLTVPLANFYQRGKFNSADNPWKSGSPSAPFDQGIVRFTIRVLSHYESCGWWYLWLLPRRSKQTVERHFG